MLLDRDASMLLVVDVQQRLIPAIHDHGPVMDSVAWLMDLSRTLGVPVRASEQYPRGLGPTVPELRQRLADEDVVEKLHFSCAADAGCLGMLEALGRSQIVLCGIETHVCVLQTALGLLGRGYRVFVVADAVSSRQPSDRQLGLDRMRDAGVTVVGREMVAFEWLHVAGTDEFKAVSREFLR